MKNKPLHFNPHRSEERRLIMKNSPLSSSFSPYSIEEGSSLVHLKSRDTIEKFQIDDEEPFTSIGYLLFYCQIATRLAHHLSPCGPPFWSPCPNGSEEIEAPHVPRIQGRQSTIPSLRTIRATNLHLLFNKKENTMNSCMKHYLKKNASWDLLEKPTGCINLRMKNKGGQQCL